MTSLLTADARLGPLIARLPAPDFTPEPQRDPFHALARAVVYQQLSGKAAATILGRALALFGGDWPEPQALIATPDADLRAAGLSFNKIRAIKDIAARRETGQIPHAEALLALSDEEIIATLTEARGVGRWTVEMYLMFTLGRPDIWPVDDLGVRQGAQILFATDETPDKKALAALGAPFSPQRSALAWYCWRAVEAGRAAPIV